MGEAVRHTNATMAGLSNVSILVNNSRSLLRGLCRSRHRVPTE